MAPKKVGNKKRKITKVSIKRKKYTPVLRTLSGKCPTGYIVSTKSGRCIKIKVPKAKSVAALVKALSNRGIIPPPPPGPQGGFARQLINQRQRLRHVKAPSRRFSMTGAKFNKQPSNRFGGHFGGYGGFGAPYYGGGHRSVANAAWGKSKPAHGYVKRRMTGEMSPLRRAPTIGGINPFTGRKGWAVDGQFAKPAKVPSRIKTLAAIRAMTRAETAARAASIRRTLSRMKMD